MLVLYGLGEQGMLPGFLSRVHPVTRTPLIATTLVTGVVLALALWFGVETLAEATSAVTLVVFSLVNSSLVLVKRRTPASAGIRVFPPWVSEAGLTFNAGFLVIEVVSRLNG
jgi:amino acid transporter